MIQILEALMIVSFGISWPVNIIKSYHARTTKGKSIFFLIFILFGYICGIAAKILSGTMNYVLVFYCINMVMIVIDIMLYVRNYYFDKG
ncbi:hypothetical protein AGMMS49574_26700 [Bacteroidia bacterium]|nr:hypothetical protein AGMMS49574_26700 [Bacteroidia bacterium]